MYMYYFGRWMINQIMVVLSYILYVEKWQTIIMSPTLADWHSSGICPGVKIKISHLLAHRTSEI